MLAPVAERERHAVAVPDGDYAIEVAGGDLIAKAEAGRITIEAMQSITLKVGQSSITIDQTGITIRGLLIDVEGGLQAGLKGLRTEIKAAGVLQLGGGLTMIG
jgi:type VI secretion system secreted protein VgrG